MSTPKFIEGPNTVQTSLYGYDRHKRVQVNNLRGTPIVVLRSDTVNSGGNGFGAGDRGFQNSGGPRSPRKWVDRSKQIPMPISNKPMYPSYAHFHHQYSCPKLAPIPPLPPAPPTAQPGSPRRSSPQSHSSPSSPRMTREDELTVKRLFDKLAVPTPSPTSASSSSSFSNISSDITLLELSPKMATKTFVTGSSMCASEADSSSSSVSPCPGDSAFLVDTPRSMSHSRQTSCSESSSVASSAGDDEEAFYHDVHDTSKPVIHTCPDETQCHVFRNGVCVNDEEERRAVLKWYDDLIQWRHDIVTRKLFGPPRCHPPPLTVTIIGASRAQRANPFHRVKDVHPFAMEAMDHARRKMDARRSYRLIPADLPLPAPHEFMANAKCMEPHLFVEYCYQLTAAAYIDTGLNPPNRRPPIPPRIEPIPEQTCRESICSSASEISSDGEYSDDSEGTKKERLRQKMERHSKRERRLQQIFKRQMLDEIGEEDD